MDQPTDTQTPSPTNSKRLPVWELIALFITDFVVYLIFAVWGEAQHNLLQARGPGGVMNVAAPFMMGWLIAAMLVGTYRGTALYPLSRVVWKSALGGLLGGILGGAIFSLARGRWSIPLFYAITTATSAVMIALWRVIWSRIRRAWWPELP